MTEVQGTSSTGPGVEGIGLPGVLGFGAISGTQEGHGVTGAASDANGVWGQSQQGEGVFGWCYRDSRSGAGGNNNGVRGASDNGVGVVGEGGNVGIFAHNYAAANDVYLATRGLAGDFYGDVYIHGRSTVDKDLYVRGDVGAFNLSVWGTLWKSGGGFRVDHPLEPADKYLSHSFVESPDMKNIYDGVALLDENGEATVELPEYFEALNGHFRYQLTPIGAAGPNLHIAEDIYNNRFRIGGGTPELKVSWQVTGTRKDRWAEANRIVAEEDKPEEERGYYMNPELYDAPEERGIRRVRPEERDQGQIEEARLRMEERRQEMEQELARFQLELERRREQRLQGEEE